MKAFLGKCLGKGCTNFMRIDVPTHEQKVTRGYTYRHTVVLQTPDWEPWQLYVHCVEHRRPLYFRPIKGVVNPEHHCDARCENAHGPNCECSCGGANHGKAYLTQPALKSSLTGAPGPVPVPKWEPPAAKPKDVLSPAS